MAGIKPTDFPVMDPNEFAENTEIYTQTGGVNKKIYLGDLVDLIAQEVAPEPESEVIIEVSDTDLKAMGDTPITLLPALPSNQYYEFSSIILKYNFPPFGGIEYVVPAFGNGDLVVKYGGSYLVRNSNFSGSVENLLLMTNGMVSGINGTSSILAAKLGQAVILTTNGGEGNNWQDGNGTVTVIIKYKVQIF